MNEEEKKAIELLQSLCIDDCINNDIVKTVINLIAKQQKEIEDLKAITRTYEAYNCREDNKIVIASKEYFINGFFKDFLSEYVSKDKIKAKIEEITSYAYTSAEERDCQDYAIQVLKELLGE